MHFFKSVVLVPGPLYVVVEFCANGDLLHFLRRQRPSSSNEQTSESTLTASDLIGYANQVARGMTYLSENKVFTNIPLQTLFEVESVHFSVSSS